jgi:hypothetical protein
LSEPLIRTWAYVERLDSLPPAVASDDARAAQWWPVSDAQAPGEFDHHQIMRDAVDHLRARTTTPAR